MGSPSTLGVSTPGVSTSAPPASGPSPGAAGAFSQALADELQRRLDEEGWQTGNPAPGRPAGESPPAGGEKAEHPLLRAGPDDLGIRFVNRDDGSGAGASKLLGFLAPGTAPLLHDAALAPSSSSLLGGAALSIGAAALGAAGILLGSTRPAGSERETGTTAGGDHFTTDERTIDVHRADGTRQQGFLNPDGNSWSTSDGKRVASRDPATGKIEIAAPSTPAGPTAQAHGNGGRLPPGGTGAVRPDGECDENANIGPTSPRSRLPDKDGHWLGEPGNSGWQSTDPRVNAVTGGKPVNFVNGRPDFTPWAKMSINFAVGELTGTGKDRALAEKALDATNHPDVQAAGSGRDFIDENDLTPHHATDTCLQLVPSALNGFVSHIGAAADIRYQGRIGWKPQP